DFLGNSQARYLYNTPQMIVLTFRCATLGTGSGWVPHEKMVKGASHWRLFLTVDDAHVIVRVGRSTFRSPPLEDQDGFHCDPADGSDPYSRLSGLSGHVAARQALDRAQGLAGSRKNRE